MATAGAGLAAARRQLGSARKVMRLTSKGELAASSKALNASASKMRNLTPAMRVSARRLEKLIDDSFDLQSAPTSKPWDELAESTKYARVLDHLYGRQRGRKQATAKSKRSGGRVSYGRTRGEKASETQGKIKKLTRKQSAKATKYMNTMKILIDTGRLRKSWYAKAMPWGIRYGTKVVYAGTHQAGRESVPARPMAPVEWKGGRWVFMTTGRVTRFLQQVREDIFRYVNKGM
jgi:phage gpG-like protein